MKTEENIIKTVEIVLQYIHTKYMGIPVIHDSMGGSRWDFLEVGREWENLMAPSLHEPEVTPSLFIFVSFVLRWEESGRTLWLYLCMTLKSLFVFSSLSPVL